MKLFVVTEKDGYPYQDFENAGWFPAFKTYWRAELKMKELSKEGITGLHIREYDRGQHRYDWDELEIEDVECPD